MTASARQAPRPTAKDVEQVRQMLLTRVPYELADIILTEAQYWARLSNKRDTYLSVSASNEPLNNAKWCYMISEPIPAVYNGEHIVPTKVKSVHFSLRSCDQGWGGYSEGRNTYRNSHTWFEASILRPPPGRKASKWINEVANHPMNLCPLTDIGWTEVQSPYRGNRRRWLLQMNAQVSRHIRRHNVIWTAGKAPQISKEGANIEISEFDHITGSGRGTGFVESLQAGDRIAIIARALYPGWENNVYSAEIEIAYQT